MVIVWADEGKAGGHGKPAVAGKPLLQLPTLRDLLQQQAERGPPAPVQEPLALEGRCSSSSDDARAVAAATCCYVLYTSGSTGRPLGVCGTEAGVLNRCRWLEGVLPFQVGWSVVCVRVGGWCVCVWCVCLYVCAYGVFCCACRVCGV